MTIINYIKTYIKVYRARQGMKLMIKRARLTDEIKDKVRMQGQAYFNTLNCKTIVLEIKVLDVKIALLHRRTENPID